MAKKDKFNYFDAFEQQVDVALEEADVLIECIEDFKKADKLESVLEKAHEIEHRGDQLNHIILTNVSTDFITPIERGDIIELAQNLDTITDMIESTMQRFYMFNIDAMHPQAMEFAVIIRKSLKALRKAMGTFREFKKVKKIRAMVEEVNQFEEQADVLYLDTIRHLYTVDAANAVSVEVWTRLFERLEGTVDACETVADTMASIMLKNV